MTQPHVIIPILLWFGWSIVGSFHRDCSLKVNITSLTYVGSQFIRYLLQSFTNKFNIYFYQAANRGIIMVNFFSCFLVPDCGQRNATIADVVGESFKKESLRFPGIEISKLYFYICLRECFKGTHVSLELPVVRSTITATVFSH